MRRQQQRAEVGAGLRLYATPPLAKRTETRNAQLLWRCVPQLCPRVHSYLVSLVRDLN